MRKSLLSSLLILCANCLIIQGCAAKRQAGISYLIPPPCISKAEIWGCDDKEPPHCKHSRIVFRRGCEEIVTK